MSRLSETLAATRQIGRSNRFITYMAIILRKVSVCCSCLLTLMSKVTWKKFQINFKYNKFNFFHYFHLKKVKLIVVNILEWTEPLVDCGSWLWRWHHGFECCNLCSWLFVVLGVMCNVWTHQCRWMLLSYLLDMMHNHLKFFLLI